jgi:hypothetical protein
MVVDSELNLVRSRYCHEEKGLVVMKSNEQKAVNQQEGQKYKNDLQAPN